jgi:glycosyltransferase involved in cell wall biosynthesis
MISNCTSSNYDLIEITNELPINRFGGVGSVIENLVSGFKSLNIKVLWFVVDHPYNNNEIKYILKNYSNVAIGQYIDLSNFNAPVVHLHTYNSNLTIFNYLKNKKIIYTIHSLMICEAISNDVDITFGIKQQEHMISVCDEIVLISEAEKKWYYKYNYHKLNSNVHIIHNGLNQIRNFEHKPLSKKVIGFCGRLVPRKRPEYVHMLLTEDDFKDCSVIVAGRGFSQYVKDILQQNNLLERVHYIGWCGGARLDSFYKAIDVLAISSVYEPFGMVALEASARGIPIVCNRIGGLAEILSDNVFYSEDITYESFRNAMKEWLHADNKILQQKTHKAYNRFINHFTDIRMAQKYLKLVKQLQ